MEGKYVGQDPKPKKQTSAAKKGWGDWNGYFVNVVLTDADKAWIKAWEFDHVRIHEWLEGRVAGGFKFSLSLQEDGSAYLASLTDRRAESGSYQGTLTGRGKTVELALTTLYFKDESVLAGHWPARGGLDDDIG